MSRVVLAGGVLALLGCVSSSPTIISVLSGNVSELGAPGCVFVQPQHGNLSGQASHLLISALRRRGMELAQSCPAWLPHVRIEIEASDVVMTTHGVMPGAVSLEANLQASGAAMPGARVWLLRTHVYHLSPEVSALAEPVLYVLQNGALPSKGVLVH